MLFKKPDSKAILTKSNLHSYVIEWPFLETPESPEYRAFIAFAEALSEGKQVFAETDYTEIDLDKSDDAYEYAEDLRISRVKGIHLKKFNCDLLHEKVFVFYSDSSSIIFYIFEPHIKWKNFIYTHFNPPMNEDKYYFRHQMLVAKIAFYEGAQPTIEIRKSLKSAINPYLDILFENGYVLK